MFINKTTKQYPLSEQDIRTLHPDTTFPDSWSKEFLDHLDIAFVSDSPKPDCNQYTQQVVEIQPVFTNNKWVKNYSVIDTPLTENKFNSMKQQLKDSATSLRYQKETSGVVLPGGTTIKTDVESQSKVNAAFVSLNSGLVSSIDWKGSNGWITLTAVEVQQLAYVIANHVKNCFSKEKKIHELIDQIQNIEQYESFDINIEWNKE